MIGPRIAVAMALGLALASAPEAKVRCPDEVDLRTCIGVAAGATVRFCFQPENACAGTGVVRSFEAPASPFAIARMRVQGALGTRDVGGEDFPLVLLPGESLLIDLSVTVATSGEERSSLELVLANTIDASDKGGKVEGEICDVDLRARAPECLPADGADQCAGKVCVDGECRDRPQQTTCDDGDACTVDDACTDQGCAGTPLDCDDGIACTQDLCSPGGCEHVPTDALCDSGECTVAACRPADPAADGRGCIQTVVGEGDACTDDGVPCTDDVCTSGTCLHVPVDTRCPGAAACGGAACTPGATTSDAAGCVSGPAGTEGGVCAEDGDPCSDDRCRAGACQHQVVDQHVTCAPVENAFRRALALLALTRSLAVSTEAVGRTQPASVRGERLTAPLQRLDAELGGAVDALAGRTIIPAAARPLAGIPETPAQARARAALLLAGRMPLDARSFMEALAATRKQGVAREQLHALMDQGRALRRGVKRLKVELKRLRRTTVQFVK
jgi:hypothetical protein